MRHAFRTTFPGGIVAEFVPPARPSRKVVVLCGGFPSLPAVRTPLSLFARRGYWAFAPRYRGSWESKGKFLARSPEEDIAILLRAIARESFSEAWGGTTFRVSRPIFFVVGSSFGGAAAILLARRSEVVRVAALSPVVDWKSVGKAEPLSAMERFVREGFGAAYRIAPGAWEKLRRGDFYSPAAAAREIPGEKVCILHARDDEIVPWRPVASFARRTGSRLALYARGGHFGLSHLGKRKRLRDRTLRFLRFGR